MCICGPTIEPYTENSLGNQSDVRRTMRTSASAIPRVTFALLVPLLCASGAYAQLQSEIVVSGLSQPVAFVQDPALADTQYVVEQGGRIRVVRGGQLGA